MDWSQAILAQVMFFAAPQEPFQFDDVITVYHNERLQRPLMAIPCIGDNCDRKASGGYQWCCSVCMRGFHKRDCHCRNEEAYHPPRIMRDIALRGQVTLLTAGYDEDGSSWLQEFWPEHSSRQHESVWHRLDVVYNKRTRLSRRGHHRSAQRELRDIFGKRCSNCIAMTLYLVKWFVANGILQMAHVLMCAHGHHRSVAHAEVSAQEIAWYFPGLEVTVVHLDHLDDIWPRRYPDSSYGPSLPTDVGYDDWEFFEQHIRYPYDNALANPPPFLLQLDLLK